MGAPARPRRARAQSPYLALVRNRNFSLLWVGQLISFFGDRIHQVALGVLLLHLGTPLDLGIVSGHDRGAERASSARSPARWWTAGTDASP